MPIIRIHEVSKRYRLGRPKESLQDSVRGLFSGLSRKGAPQPAEFWALEGIDLEIERGDVLGIIGRNGAGKSTLFKILARITAPTTGYVELDGKAAALLEVGTGFHSDLTGRENVFLNGAILGMTRREIQARLDAIVAFAGVEKFLDTPVKHYSSGMSMRLAFAVAAHLEPDILIIDEVLAVGDADFQKKCLARIKEVSSQDGRTVLFVSHNMATVKHLCKVGVVLDRGRLVFSGDPSEAIERYLKSGASRVRLFDLSTVSKRRGARFIEIREVELSAELYRPDSDFGVGLRLRRCSQDFSASAVHVAVFVVDSLGNIVYHLGTYFTRPPVDFDEQATYRFGLDVLGLKPGIYGLWVWLQSNGVEQDFVDTEVFFEVADGNIYGAADSHAIIGAVQRRFSFSVEQSAPPASSR